MHAEEMERTVADYSFWWHAHARMTELLADPATPEAERPTYARRQANYARMMAEYRETKDEPSVDEIRAHKPVISTPEKIRAVLEQQARKAAEG